MHIFLWVPFFNLKFPGWGGGFFLCVYVYPPHTIISKQKEATGNGGEITMGRGLHDERGFSLLVAEGGNITKPNPVMESGSWCRTMNV